MVDPANGLIMAACILIVGCIGLSVVAFTLHVRRKHRVLASLDDRVNS